MKLAAIDIGSNAIRLLVEEIITLEKGHRIEKISLTRVPIRLGEDVFESGYVSEEKEVHLIQTMKAFRHLMDAMQVEHFRACATSAMREAKNQEHLLKRIHQEAGIQIEVIEGKLEADLIFSNFKVQKIDHSGDYIYIDVGGGSTEVTLIKNGKRVKAKSFKIGTVRALKGKVSKKLWVESRAWIKDLVEKEEKLIAIGTGGNINRIHKECGKKAQEMISKNEIKELYEYFKGFTYKQRIDKLRLKPDRADVILPASEIYYNFMKFAGVKKMIVPKLGLADGIILSLFKEWEEKEINQLKD